jgi:transposase InsO family protein
LYKHHGSARAVLVGVCLWVVLRNLGGRIPSLSDYCEAVEVSDDTIRRTARWLMFPVVRLLRSRRPGCRKRAEPSTTLLALQAMNDLLHALLPSSIPKLLKSAAARGMVVQQVLFWREKGVLLRDLAAFLSTSPRQLTRWIDRLDDKGGGCEAPQNSRRPHTSPNQVPDEVQHALIAFGAACQGFSIAETTRVFNARFGGLLELYDLGPLSEKTVGKYVSGRRSKTASKRKKSRRGAYEYPPPMTMAWVDTTHFNVAGMRVHIVVAMEAFSRTTLAGEAVVQENSEVAAAVLSEALTRAPGLRALVRDRGKPYLNSHIDALLADHGCQPIDAHPYFPIDKAALERFFGTAKPWLRAALAHLEAEWSRRPPSRDEVLSAVRAALQVLLRAYNLIPQPYLEAKCPFQRLEAALRDAGAQEPQLERFAQLAHEREDKAAVLARVRDGLQIDISMEQMLRDFVSIDKRAIQSAFDTCFDKLVVQRDQEIRWPYRYLRAVAWRKNRELQKELARARRAAEDDATRRAEQHIREQECRREDEERARHPERYLPPDLEAWLRFKTQPGLRDSRLGEHRLRGTLCALARKLGAALDAYVHKVSDTIPRILDRLQASHPDPAAVSAAFLKLAQPQPTSHPPPPGVAPTRTSCNNITNLVRQALAAIPMPHDGTTNVRP